MSKMLQVEKEESLDKGESWEYRQGLSENKPYTFPYSKKTREKLLEVLKDILNYTFS